MISDLISWIQDIFTNEPSSQEKLEMAQNECRRKLQELKQAIADITTQKKKLELQKNRLEDELKEQRQKAEEKVNEGDESSAKRVIRHKKRNEARISDLEDQIRKMSQIQDDLTSQKTALEHELRDIKTTRSNIEARRKAAEAEMIASEALSDIDGGNVEETMQSLQRETERLESRAEVARKQPDSIFEDELENSEEEVEKELEELKN
jgi:phage shock protein A